jgi:hypothetical protein
MICGTDIQADSFDGKGYHFDIPIRHPDKEPFQGFILKALCFEVRWKYPWSAVWLESSIAVVVGEHRFVLLRKKFRQATPQLKIITQEMIDQQKKMDAGRVERPVNLNSPFWGEFTKWKSAGMPDAWSDHSGQKRAAATLEKINPRGAEVEDGFDQIVNAMKKADEANKDGGTGRAGRAAAALDHIEEKRKKIQAISTAPVIEGYVLSDLSEITHGCPPFNGLQRAFGSLVLGNTKPSLIYSSKAVMDDVLFRMIPSQIKPVTYNTKDGFFFNNAVWLQDDRLEGTKTVVLLNESWPDNPKLNGYYEYPLQEERTK